MQVPEHNAAKRSSSRVRALLAWLALHPGAQPRSHVAGVFWPDVLETSARGSLRAAETFCVSCGIWLIALSTGSAWWTVVGPV